MVGTLLGATLAAGRPLEALRFNPAAVLGVGVVGAWALLGWTRYRLGAVPPPPDEQNRRVVRNLVVVGAVLALNWIYLLFYLP